MPRRKPPPNKFTSWEAHDRHEAAVKEGKFSLSTEDGHAIYEDAGKGKYKLSFSDGAHKFADIYEPAAEPSTDFKDFKKPDPRAVKAVEDADDKAADDDKDDDKPTARKAKADADDKDDDKPKASHGKGAKLDTDDKPKARKSAKADDESKSG